MIAYVFKGILDKLLADATVAAAVGSRVWNTLAPENATYPYIVLTHAAGGTPNDNQRDAIDIMIDVKIIDDDQPTALSLTSSVYSALHRQDLTLGNGWDHYSTHHQLPIFYAETVEGRQYWHAGGTYRIRASR